jgi:hypothetical protein
VRYEIDYRALTIMRTAAETVPRFLPHGARAWDVPRIEVADDRNTGGIWRPHRRSHATDAVDRQGSARQLEMPAIVE